MRGLALVALTLLVIGVYSRIAVTRQYDWIWSPDLVNQVYPWLEVQAAAWQSGQIPLWDPYIWGGQPLHGQVQPGAAYPLNWLLFSLPQKDGFIRYGFLDWYFVLLHLMAAWFAYLLARGLGTSRFAGIVCGLIFSLGGFLGRADWPQMMNSALWTPLVLLAIFRTPGSVRPLSVAALGGLALGIAFLSGHHQVPIFLAIAAGLLWLAQILRGAIFRPRMAVAAALFFVCAGLIAAVQVLPSLEYGKEAVRWIGFDQPASWKDTVPYQVHETFASHPHRLLGLVIPNIFDHYDHFIGICGLLLVALGVAATLQRWETRALVTMAVMAMFAAMGGFTVFHGLLYAFVPMVEKARNPAAISALLSVAMAVLAAIGVDTLRKRQADHAASVGAKVLATAGAILFLVGGWLYMSHSGTFPTDDRFHIVAICALLLAGLLVAWRQQRISAAWLMGGLLVLLVAELSVSALLPFPSKLDSKRPGSYRLRYHHQDIADYLRGVPGFQRGQVDGNAIGIALGDLYQIQMFEGYTASVPASIWELGMSQRRVLELYGVKTWVARQPLYEGQRQVREFADGFKAWELEDAFPRVWIARQAISLDSIAAFRAKLDTGQFGDRAVVPFVGPAPQLPACNNGDVSGDEAAIAEYHMNRVLIRARSNCGGLLVISDNAFPGWNAFVNGRQAEILRPYHSLRGVVIGAGEQTIEMRYSPTSFSIGALLTLLGFALMGAVLWFEPRILRH
ncbi:MAG: hypothetical protein KIT83_13765 [Bryobacterales bacterium]|nr:hypothetical protein [Bryobacterales bacterium]